MFHNILVAVDGSPDADEALKQAIDLAESEHARLTLFSSLVTPPAAAYLGAGGEVAATIAANAETETEAILRAAVERVPDELSVSSVLSSAPVRPALIRQIKDGAPISLSWGPVDAARCARCCSAASATTRCTTVLSRFSSCTPIQSKEANRPRPSCEANRRPTGGSSMQERDVGSQVTVGARAQESAADPFSEVANGRTVANVTRLVGEAQEAARGMVEAEDALRVVLEHFERTEDPEVQGDLAAEALDHVERQLTLTRQRRQGLDSIEGKLWARRNALERFLIHARGRAWWRARRSLAQPGLRSSERT